MLILTIIVTCLFGSSRSLPLQYQQSPLQYSPLRWIYPGLQPPISYQPIPVVSTYPISHQPLQDNHLQGTSPSFRQGFPGNIIGALPFLPIHINVPDIVASIIKGLQSVFGALPIIQQGNTPGIVQDVILTPEQQNGMLPLGMIPKHTMLGQGMPMMMPMPIIILVPVKQDSEIDIERKV